MSRIFKYFLSLILLILLSACQDGKDTTAPTISIALPLDEETVRGIVDIEIQAKDDNAIFSVILMLNDSIIQSFPEELQYTPYTFSTTYTWNTVIIPNGEHSLSAKVTDQYNNKGLSNLIKVSVEN